MLLRVAVCHVTGAVGRVVSGGSAPCCYRWQCAMLLLEAVRRVVAGGSATCCCW